MHVLPTFKLITITIQTANPYSLPNKKKDRMHHNSISLYLPTVSCHDENKDKNWFVFSTSSWLPVVLIDYSK